ncbi:hypothetical protein CCR75_009087 [Bremia lactucae]|uniref:Nucleolar protein 6 n=1 Tax=Bremia lactucae TaxID=4779 RepID=A0A976FPA6_BRELC|nr:hypothetical protein CCR75_009087 [Bremia lactucae]
MALTSPIELRKALSKYALPSTTELRHLRAADPTTSYRASFFRLQIDELLTAIGRKPSAKASSGLQRLLFQVKEIVQNLQPQHVTQDALQSYGLLVRNFVKRKEIVLPFQPPARLDVVGSYILDTMVFTGKQSNEYGSISIDVTIEMPEKCFVPKDFGNYRYFDKRNLYLGVVALALESSTELFQHVTLQAWHGDYDKPVAKCTVTSDFLTQNGMKGATVWIRIIPVIPMTVFKLTKLNPLRNNVKLASNRTEDAMKECSTPMYNNSILEDMRLRQHTRELYAVLQDAPQFAEACLLAKVWLRQRGFQKAIDSLNGFLISMVLLYLYEKKRVIAQTSSDQMFKVLLQFLALHKLESEPLQFLPENEGGVVLTTEGMQAFRRSFDVVFLDSSGRFNLFGRVSRSAWKELQIAAVESLNRIQHGTLEDFQALFIKTHAFWTRYDQYYWFPAPLSIDEAEKDTYTLSETHEIHDMGVERFWVRKLESIISKALTNRVNQVRSIVEDDVEWSMHDRGLPRLRKVVIGVRVSIDNALRIVDKGPSVDDKAASSEFRHFWRGRSELRRFKDGAILEAIVWEDLPTEHRHRVLDVIVQYIVPAHCPQVATADITTSNTALYSLLDVEKPTSLKAFETLPSSFVSTMNSVSMLWKSFNTFAKTLRDLESLPLKISDVLPVHSAFRATSLFPAQPHPLAYSKGEHVDAVPMAHVTNVLEPLVLHLVFERTSAWPNEKKALMHAKTGFYVQIGHELHSRYQMRCEVATDCVDVLIHGYVFRIVIRCEKELSVVTGATGRKKLALVHSWEYVKLKRETEYLSKHASLIHALHTKNSSYGSTVRLVQKWLAAKVLSNVLSIEAVELIVADVFSTSSSMRPPQSIFSGFIRFLKRVASFKWQHAPLIVDLNASLTDTTCREILKRFEASQTSGSTHPGMFIAAEYEDMDCLSSWTRFGVDQVLVQRFRNVAQASYNELITWLSSGASLSGWKRAFRTSNTKEFDAMLMLAVENLPSKQMCVPGDTKHPFVASVYKNMDLTAIPVMIGFDPVQELLRDLHCAFGHVAYFFINAVDTTEIRITWKPQAFLPIKFRAITAKYQMPLRSSNTEEDCKDSCVSVPNIFEILSDMQRMSHGIVLNVVVQPFENA